MPSARAIFPPSADDKGALFTPARCKAPLPAGEGRTPTSPSSPDRMKWPCPSAASNGLPPARWSESPGRGARAPVAGGANHEWELDRTADRTQGGPSPPHRSGPLHRRPRRTRHRTGGDGAFAASACANPRCRRLDRASDGRSAVRPYRSRHRGKHRPHPDAGSHPAVRAAEPRRLSDARPRSAGARDHEGAVCGRAGGDGRRRERSAGARCGRGGGRRVRAAAGGDDVRAGAGPVGAGVG